MNDARVGARNVNLRFFIPALVAAVAFLAVAASGASALATRTWVSGVGDDANPCSRTAPCKTFAAAHLQTTAGGTISVLDPGGYGSVTITKAITIDGTGTLASVLVGGTNGINVVAGASDIVILKGLQIESTTSSGVGVRVASAGSVLLQDSLVHGFGFGVLFDGSSGSTLVTVRSSTISNNSDGVVSSPAGAAASTILVDSSLVTDGNTGFIALGRGKVVVARSTVANEIYAFASDQPGAFSQPAANVFVSNGHLRQLLTATAPFGISQFVGKARAGVRLKFMSTASASAVVTIKKGTRVVAKFNARVKESASNSILWNGKSGRAYAAKGVYDVTVAFNSGEGQTQAFTGTVKLI